MPRTTGRRLLLLCCFSLLTAFGPVQANDYLDELIQQARTLRLAEQQEWYDLLHYHLRDDGLGVYSLADSRNFFNAENGKYDSAAELEATLGAFFSNIKESDTEQNPQCAFIARYQWLKAKLHFDSKRLPENSCRRFHNWYKAINPEQVTMIFPAAYVNNPSSMFGHTLLRVDMPNQDERTRLASYAINYAAETKETNGVVFATKAIVGGYPGFFSIMPYYEKVKEYSDLENRDIWEYQLNLNAAEIRRLLEHAWELGPVRFDYFFFDENCSYQLLALLDVARPGMELHKHFPGWAIPSDTVRVALREKNMLKKAIYRPSSLTLLKHQLQQLDGTEQQLALDLSQGTLAPDASALSHLDDQRKAMVLESAYDYLQYQFNTGKWERSEASQRSLRLLRARSRLALQQTVVPLPVPAVRPEQGHDTARLALYHGWNENEAITDIYLRPAYHDLLDADGGYQQGAQIDFFDLQFRHLHKQDKTTLESFTLVDIVSLTPRNRFFDPISWHVSTGLEHFTLPQSGKRPLLFSVRGGGGPSYRLGSHQLASFMLDAALLADNTLPDGYAAAIGPAFSWSWGSLQSPWKFQLNSRLLAFGNRLDMNEVDHHFQCNLQLQTDLSLRLSLRSYGEQDNTSDEARLGLHWYF